LAKGIVIKSTGNISLVKTEEGRYINCRIKGAYRIMDIKATNPVTVGDVVHFTISNDGTVMIHDIEERRNYIIRKASNLSKQYQLIAANIDTAWIVASLVSPRTFTEFIDRFLVSAEAYRIPVSIIFNKIDIYDEPELKELEDLLP
jgi:ribosome biogenesis GTPase